MQESNVAVDREAHKRYAIDCLDLVWQLVEKKGRSRDEDDRMVHAAHASRFHWGEVGSPENLERGEWQISRVYAILGRAEPALYHARRCLEICEQNGIGDWDIAFAYEAMARAHSLSTNRAECERYAAQAKEAGERIVQKEDRDLFFSEMKSLSCG